MEWAQAERRAQNSFTRTARFRVQTHFSSYINFNIPFSSAEEPSMCYYYDGDGVCEDFERETGVRDCGLYTPSGFLDQWASSVDVSHEAKPYCSGEVASGYPAVTKVSLYIASPVASEIWA